jgi:hypothetical protein
MTTEELKVHLASIKALHSEYKSIQNDRSRILYHEIAVVKSELVRRVNQENAQLAKKVLKDQKKTIYCPHCNKKIILGDP